MPWVAVLKWMFLTVLLSILPITLQVLIDWMQSGNYKFVFALKGGELFIVSCGLAAASIGETLPARGAKTSAAHVLFPVILLVNIALSTALYGAVVISGSNSLDGARSPEVFDANRIAALSSLVFLVSLATSLISIVISRWGHENG
jgi:hypothetical protein